MAGQAQRSSFHNGTKKRRRKKEKIKKTKKRQKNIKKKKKQRIEGDTFLHVPSLVALASGLPSYSIRRVRRRYKHTIGAPNCLGSPYRGELIQPDPKGARLDVRLGLWPGFQPQDGGANGGSTPAAQTSRAQATGLNLPKHVGASQPQHHVGKRRAGKLDDREILGPSGWETLQYVLTRDTSRLTRYTYRTSNIASPAWLPPKQAPKKHAELFPRIAAARNAV